jgi:hypothetical protein
MLPVQRSKNLVDYLLELVVIRQMQGEGNRLTRKFRWQMNRST